MAAAGERGQRATRAHSTPDERATRGRAARKAAPRSLLAAHAPDPARDPLAVLAQQDAGRQQDLVPIRYGRMAASPFAFLRGAAAVMAADLAGSPVTGLRVQAVGDAHISNFGVFASPDRRLVFDVNDFDETLPAPWEWDVKRLVASVAVAGLENGMTRKTAAAAANRAAAAYRVSMGRFAASTTLDVWYAHLDVEDLAAATATAKQQAKAQKLLARIRGRTSAQVVGKLTEVVDGELRFRSLPPLVTPLRELVGGDDAELAAQSVKAGYRAYRASLAPEHRLLVDRFRMVDIARKVVGVGSVGSRCFIALLLGRDQDDALVLQFKEAGPSVLEASAGRSAYRHHGARVVQGQRVIQLESDIFLGWTSLPGSDAHYYWRQLKDMKASAEISLLRAREFVGYVDACSWCLANAHARSGDPVAIAAYLGQSGAFDRAMEAFALAYSDQTQADWRELTRAIADGRIEAAPGV
jgi:uncharacterized protein (DUF2252 family)